jgi:flagellar biosynthesis GTPase FlhF
MFRQTARQIPECATLTIERKGLTRPMARILKTYQTSLGFFDLAIAAPSMKAALEAWGADSNLFHQGAAKESHDPDIIAATMAKPGIVLRRPVGTDRPFSEHAELPTDLGGGGPTSAARKSKGPKAKKLASRPVDKTAERKAALDYEREERRRELERAKEEAARQKERERRQRAVDKAQAALDKAEQEHAKRAAAIQAEVETLEKRSQTEEARWDKEKERLQAALRRARG